ncbi:uncharacterized protein MONBRDRAFT_4993 [Monosiga brevicollis MX1]|uniref:Uncharacterized protein n=1 Tax=Monosiga brevicollis TaxID=81824 RepID=A9UPK6_MONBE|nr:uncharacterized protein MONBRDRAFT_4993 [Monosiga brevicollis MX1]EDQ92886.1 predicted protein [Monosiga brevicollis MX1]|eukprot:XP_001742648.1 hypothetical protein [Monosiga brevicollis MX1]
MAAPPSTFDAPEFRRSRLLGKPKDTLTSPDASPGANESRDTPAAKRAKVSSTPDRSGKLASPASTVRGASDSTKAAAKSKISNAGATNVKANSKSREDFKSPASLKAVGEDPKTAKPSHSNARGPLINVKSEVYRNDPAADPRIANRPRPQPKLKPKPPPLQENHGPDPTRIKGSDVSPRASPKPQAVTGAARDSSSRGDSKHSGTRSPPIETQQVLTGPPRVRRVILKRKHGETLASSGAQGTSVLAAAAGQPAEHSSHLEPARAGSAAVTTKAVHEPKRRWAVGPVRLETLSGPLQVNMWRPGLQEARESVWSFARISNLGSSHEALLRLGPHCYRPARVTFKELDAEALRQALPSSDDKEQKELMAHLAALERMKELLDTHFEVASGNRSADVGGSNAGKKTHPSHQRSDDEGDDDDASARQTSTASTPRKRPEPQPRSGADMTVPVKKKLELDATDARTETQPSKPSAPKSPTSTAKSKAKAEGKPDPKPKIEVKTDVKSKPKSEANPKVKPEAKSSAKSEVKPEAKLEAKPEIKSLAKSSAKSSTKAEVKAKAKVVPERSTISAATPPKQARSELKPKPSTLGASAGTSAVPRMKNRSSLLKSPPGSSSNGTTTSKLPDAVSKLLK